MLEGFSRPSALKRHDRTSLKAFTDFIRTLEMSPLGQGSASSLGRGWELSQVVSYSQGPQRMSWLSKFWSSSCVSELPASAPWGAGGLRNLHFKKLGKWP